MQVTSCQEAHSWQVFSLVYLCFICAALCHITRLRVSLSSVGCRADVEGQESCVAGAGHAQSVPAAGGAGSLHNDANGKPECDWLRLRSACKLFICPSIIPRRDLFGEIQRDDRLV